MDHVECAEWNRRNAARTDTIASLMVLLITSVVTLAGLFLVTTLLSRSRRPQVAYMSNQWLAEQRRSHS
jgi:Flp pilus assembly protein protease CpaA